MPLQYFVILSFFLFAVGIILVLTQKHLIVMLFGIEFMFNAANINFVAFDQMHGRLSGQVFSIFILLIAACETAVSLAIIIHLYKYFKNVNPEKINALNEKI